MAGSIIRSSYSYAFMHATERFLLLFISISAVYILLYLVSGATDILLLSPSLLLKGEVWRLFTYQFVHQTFPHLIENLLALFLSVLIAIELKVDFSVYSITYFSAGVLAILPLWLISPFVALGASSAIYGSLGYLSRSAHRFEIRPTILLAGITTITIIGSLFTYFSNPGSYVPGLLKQFLAHISGLLFGYYACIMIARIREGYAARKIVCLKSAS